MYEHFRNELMGKLNNLVDDATIMVVLSTIDIISNNYDFTKKETSLAVIGEEKYEYIKMYIVAKRIEGLSNNSLLFYGGRLKLFLDTVNKKATEVTVNDIRVFLYKYQKQTGDINRTMDKFRQIINGFYAWMVDEGYMNNNPCKNVNKIKFEPRPRKALTRLQLEQLRCCCENLRDAAILEILYSTGCRISELCNIKISDIDEEKDSIQILGKGGKYNTVYINARARVTLNNYLKTRNDDNEYLFVGLRAPYNKIQKRNIERIFREYAKKLNLDITPHIIRHTTATLALQNSMPIDQVQKMLGHKNISTTQIYAETLESQIRESHIRYVA